MWQILILKMISEYENSNKNSKNQVLEGKKNQLRTVVTLGPTSPTLVQQKQPNYNFFTRPLKK